MHLNVSIMLLSGCITSRKNNLGESDSGSRCGRDNKEVPVGNKGKKMTRIIIETIKRPSAHNCTRSSTEGSQIIEELITFNSCGQGLVQLYSIVYVRQFVSESAVHIET